MNSSSALPAAAVVASLALFAAASASSQSLALAQTIDLPAVAGRIDHLDIDLEGNRLFVAALAAGSLEVIDLRTGKRTTRFAPLSEPQGVAYVPARRRVVVASGGSGRVEAYGARRPRSRASRISRTPTTSASMHEPIACSSATDTRWRSLIRKRSRSRDGSSCPDIPRRSSSSLRVDGCSSTCRARNRSR